MDDLSGRGLGLGLEWTRGLPSTTCAASRGARASGTGTRRGGLVVAAAGGEAGASASASDSDAGCRCWCWCWCYAGADDCVA